MPLFMVERVLKLCRGRSKGYNHYGLPVSDIGVSDTRIQIAGAHVLIGIHQIQPPASNPLKVGDDTVGIIAVHRIIYPYFPIIIRYVKFLYYHRLHHLFPHDRIAGAYAVGIEPSERHSIVSVHIIYVILNEQCEMGFVSDRTFVVIRLRHVCHVNTVVPCILLQVYTVLFQKLLYLLFADWLQLFFFTRRFIFHLHAGNSP
nr:MAG TPA: hypothetical protein [Caudoviricetes sp.]